MWSPRIEEISGRFVAASNATLLATTDDGSRVVYKPHRGERPLWDFPAETLAARESLTYEVSDVMGLDAVPETVLGDGPFGEGSIQRFVDTAPDFDPLDAVQSCDPALWPLAVLDIVCNNADRKLGHILNVDGRITGIDHGLTFHEEDKLRTVLWGFAGMPVPANLLAAASRLGGEVTGGFGNRVAELLGRPARDALALRIETLVSSGTHPHPPQDRPAIPWPPH